MTLDPSARAYGELATITPPHDTQSFTLSDDFIDLAHGWWKDHTTLASIVERTPFLKALGERGVVGTIPAGGDKTFEFTIEYVEKPDTLDRVEVFTAAEYLQRQHAVSLSFAGLANVEPQQFATKMVTTLTNGLTSHLDDLNRTLTQGDGTADNGNSMHGLPVIIADDPRNIVAGIDADKWEFWRNQSVDASTYPSLYDAMSACARQCSHIDPKTRKHTQRPTSWMANERIYTAYVKEHGSADFKGIPGCQVDVLPGHLYFVNHDYLQFAFLKGCLCRLQRGAQASFTIGQLCTGNRKRLGVVHGITL